MYTTTTALLYSGFDEQKTKIPYCLYYFSHICGFFSYFIVLTRRCVITLIHIPSIYPPPNEPWNWTHGIINFYIDHKNKTNSGGDGGDDDTAQSNFEATNYSGKRDGNFLTPEPQPNISISLLELAGESKFNQPDDNPTIDGTPWGIDMMGRTAITGGVYSTVRIPFQSSIRITIQAPPSAKGQSVYWMIVRGLEGFGGITLGNNELVLPPTSTLRVVRIPPTKLDNYEFITLATSSTTSGNGGALLRITLDTSGPDFHYLEGCLRLVTNINNEKGNMNDASNLIYLSSGMEDYFLGASYFDAGKLCAHSVMGTSRRKSLLLLDLLLYRKRLCTRLINCILVLAILRLR